MSAPNLATNMVSAHSEAAKRALMDLRAAAVAPALFKSEWPERAQADYDRALAGMELWSA